MSGLCKDCKWWASGKDGTMADLSGKLGDCLAAQDMPGDTKAFPLGLESDEEGDPILAVLITERDFGCNQHEPKD